MGLVTIGTRRARRSPRTLHLCGAFKPSFNSTLRAVKNRTGDMLVLGRILPAIIVLTLLLSGGALAQGQEPELKLRLTGGGSQASLSLPLQILILLTFLTFLPAALISLTSFTRIIVVLHFLRQALGTQSTPTNQTLIGLALFLTFFIMAPVGDRVYQQALQPLLEGKVTLSEALRNSEEPLRGFMLRQTREKDLALFVGIAKLPQPRNAAELPLRVIVPAFMISELQTAFQIGFAIFLPFLVIDLVVSSVVLSLGMLQLPPIIISTPFKILLFVLADGWNLIVGSLVRSFV